MKPRIILIVSLAISLISSIVVQAAPQKASAAVVGHSEQGIAKIAFILEGTATTADGQLLQAGSWIGPDQLVKPNGRTVIVTAAVQVIELVQSLDHSTGFAASHDSLAEYCAGCAWGCGKSVGWVVNPDGVLDEDFCNEFKGDVCVEKGPKGSSLHHIEASMAAWVPCDD